MPDVPKPVSGYLVVNPGWDPHTDPSTGWSWQPPTPAGLKEARADRAHAQWCGVPKRILKFTTTYELVEEAPERVAPAAARADVAEEIMRAWASEEATTERSPEELAAEQEAIVARFGREGRRTGQEQQRGEVGTR